ncbi:peptidoglycan-binding protein [Vibrio jasicida]|uniref:peptidoglycan-binding protein n=1 Tax=Vibrio jasicida TaxID=766224 RepID=UPI0006984FEC|nr:peptidoglycan-binding protein [Vibrio jasicida]
MNNNQLAIYEELKEIESRAKHALELFDESNKPTFPNEPIKKIENTAYINRLNAVWFDGQMNETQRNCAYLFGLSLLFVHLAGHKIYYQYLAYMLATVYHETAFTMKSIAEYGKGKGRPYGEPDPRTGKIYYGRSYPQLTWYDNYKKASEQLFNKDLKQGQVDFLRDPDFILDPYYGVQVTLFGMLGGWFTGKALDDYWLENGSYDYVQARRIINGTDKAQTIAGYAREAESAILLSMGDAIERDVLRVGSRGDDVRELQLALNISPDGVFGSNVTEVALIEYQEANNLTPDGVAGGATWRSIEHKVYGL